MNLFIRSRALFLAAVFFSLIFISCINTRESVEDNPATDFTSKDAAAISDDTVTANDETLAKEAQEIELKAENTKEILKDKEKDVEAAQKEAEEIAKEKEAIAKDLQAKKTAAELTTEKANTLKEEARITKDPKALKQAKELTAEAIKLEKEAGIHEDELKVVEEKQTTAQQKVTAYQTTVNSLKNELEELKKARAAKRTLKEKLIVSGTIIGVGIFLFIIMRLFMRFLERHLTKKDVLREDEITLRVKTTGKLFYWLGGVGVVGTVIYMVLEVNGISVGPLIAGAGIMGLAFGFGGQYLIRDLINGIFILLEGQYRINDVIKIGEHGGLVEDINLRITTLRDLEGRVIIIPNGEIKTVVNYTKEYAQALLDIGVAYKENVDEVMKVIEEVCGEMRKDSYFGRLILGDVEMFGVDDFGDSQVTIKFRLKTLPIKQWEVMRELRRRIKNRFDELGIEIPFPHRTVYWGTGKDNEWVRDFADKIASR